MSGAELCKAISNSSSDEFQSDQIGVELYQRRALRGLIVIALDVDLRSATDLGVGVRWRWHCSNVKFKYYSRKSLLQLISNNNTIVTPHVKQEWSRPATYFTFTINHLTSHLFRKRSCTMVPTTSSSFTLHTSFSTIIPLYHSFLLDQFGVIHNGSEALHGAVNCIEAMLRENKKLAILSNTSSPSHVALGRLSKYGLRADMFAGGLVSSGEECIKYVRETYGSSREETKALWFTWNESEKQSPLQFLECCETERSRISIAESVSEADFILLHGSEVWRRAKDLNGDTSSTGMVQDLNFMYNQDFSTIDPILAEASKRNLPMLCANPDLIVALQGGIVGNMPGQIAQRYESMGGTVTQFGKPNPRHFIACLENLGVSTENTKHVSGVAHVGDSLEHDIAGANSAGIDSVFVLGGIHARDLGLMPTSSGEIGINVLEDGDERIDASTSNSITKTELMEKLNRLFAAKHVVPTHVVPSLSL